MLGQGVGLGEARHYTPGVTNHPWPKTTPLGQGDVQLYWGRVEAAIQFAANTLTEAELKRASVFRFERDQRAFVARRAALRHLLGRHSELDPAGLSIEIGAHGKPFLAEDPGLSFNSSNSGGRFLIAVGRVGELGVDLQEHRLGGDPIKLAESVFTSLEREELGKAPESEHLRLFFRGWTRKEAALKALGTGFMQEARELHVGLRPADPTQGAWSVEGEPKLAQFRLMDLEAPEGFSAAFCGPASDWSLRED